MAEEIKNAQEDLEERGRKAGEEIAEILKKYNVLISVDVSGASDFIKGLKPTLIDNTEKHD